MTETVAPSTMDDPAEVVALWKQARALGWTVEPTTSGAPGWRLASPDLASGARYRAATEFTRAQLCLWTDRYTLEMTGFPTSVVAERMRLFFGWDDDPGER